MPPKDYHLQFKYVLKQLLKVIPDLKSKKEGDFIVFYGYDSNYEEDTNDILYTSAVLKDEKAIEDYKVCKITKKEEVRLKEDKYDPTGLIEYKKIKYTLKPYKLHKFMIDNSFIPKYELKMDNKRRVILNKTYLLITLNFDSPNFYFIKYILMNSRKIINRRDIGVNNIKASKRFHTILEQTIKNPQLIKVFFPNVSKDSVEFRNDVTTKDLSQENINENKIKEYLKTLQKIK